MTFSRLEDAISLGNPIRFTDAFIENIDLGALVFKVNLGLFPTFYMSQKNTVNPT